MMLRTAAGFAAALLAAPAGPAAVVDAAGALAVGAPVTSATALAGLPTAVASLDAGHRFSFGETSVYVDDDGTILAIERRSGTPTLPVDGRERPFPIGRYTRADAERELADVAEFAGPALRSYRLAPQRDLVLDFGDGERLVRLVYGESGQLARLGLLPGDPAARAVPYAAPVLRTPPLAGRLPGLPGQVYRLAIDRGGAVTRVDAFLPPREPAVQSAAAAGEAALAGERFRPATLGGRAIAATVFVEVPR